MPLKSTHRFDQTIADAFFRGGPYSFGKSKKSLPTVPAFGIEIELENVVINDVAWKWNWWQAKGENSLRNHGVEFVSLPAPFAQRAEVLAQVPKMIKAYSSTKPDLSIRCSTHMHLNVSHMTMREVLHAMLTWYLLENLIVRTQSNYRQGNLFCLRMCDAESISTSLFNVIEDPGRFNTIFNKNAVKYSALNLAPIHELGTVEWRFLSPMTDPTLLNFWLEIFQSLLEYGAAMKIPDRLMQDYNSLNIQELFKKIFGKGNGSTLYEMVHLKYPSYEAMTAAIHRNYDYIFDLGQELKRNRFEVAPAFWNPDEDFGGHSVPASPQPWMVIEDVVPAGWQVMDEALDMPATLAEAPEESGF